MNLSTQRIPPLYLTPLKMFQLLIFLVVVLIPLIVYKGAYFITEFPKMIIMFMLTPLLMLIFTWIPAEKRKPVGAMGLLIYIYLAWLLFNSITSLDPWISFFGYYGNFTGYFFFLFSLSFFFLGNQFQAHKTEFSIFLLVTATIVAIIAIVNFWGGEARATSTLGNPIILANFLVLVSPCLFGVLISNILKTRLSIFLALSSLYLLTISQALTISRAGWFVQIITYILFAFFVGRKQLWEKRRIIIIMLVVIMGAVVTSGLLIHYQPNNSLIYSKRLEIQKEVVDWQRVYLLRAAGRVFLDYPLGAGLSTFYFTGSKYFPKEITQDTVSTYVHNDFLDTLANQGIIGGLCYLIMIILLFKTWFDWKRNAEKDWLSAGLWTGIFGYLLVVQASFPAFCYTYLFWFLIGMVNTNPKSIPMKMTLNPIVKRIFWGLIFIGSIYFCVSFFIADHLYVQAAHAHDSKRLEAASYLVEKSIKLAPWVDIYLYLKIENDLQLLNSLDVKSEKCKVVLQRLKPYVFRVANRNSLNHQNLFLLGSVMLNLKSYQAAIKFYEQASNVYPTNSSDHSQKGIALLYLGELAQAELEFQKALELMPENKKAQEGLEWIQKNKQR